MLLIRDETPPDVGQVRMINITAFDQPSPVTREAQKTNRSSYLPALFRRARFCLGSTQRSGRWIPVGNLIGGRRQPQI